MSNTSASGGYLAPDSAFAPPLEDDGLDDLLQTLMVGVTGLAAQMVRPRWQPEPPDMPAISVDWGSVGVTDRPADTYVYEVFDPTANGGNGGLVVSRHESLAVLCTFYGPNCQANASRLRDGLYVGQNREILLLNGIALTEVSGLTRAPELIKNRWVPRTDVTVTLRRVITREYPVDNILSVVGTLTAKPALARSISTEALEPPPGGDTPSLDFEIADNSQNHPSIF